MKALRYIALLLLCLAMVSCQGKEGESETTGTSDTSAADLVTASETLPETATENSETMKDEDGNLMFVVDYQTYGASIASALYDIRMNGNPDELSTDCVAVDHMTDIQIEPLQAEYSLQDAKAQWGIKITSISDQIVLDDYSEYLNLEKYTDGEWVRQAIVDDSRLIRKPIGQMTSSDTLKGQLQQDALTISVDDIYPSPTPGQYRFIFYISCQNGEEIEYRQYYIPFEVVE